MWKIFKDSLKELSIGIIILGLARQLLYYKNFGLPIKYFLGVSELWLVISDDLIFIAPFIFFMLFLNHKMKDTVETNILIKSTLTDKIVIGVYIGIGITLLVAFFLTSSYQEKLILGLANVIFIISFIAPFLPGYFNITLKQYFPFFSISLFICMIIFMGILDIRRVEHGRYTGTIVTTEEKKYISNDSVYFIGKTDKYVFIHYKLKKSNIIIPIDLVTEMEIKTNGIYSK